MEGVEGYHASSNSCSSNEEGHGIHLGDLDLDSVVENLLGCTISDAFFKKERATMEEEDCKVAMSRTFSPTSVIDFVGTAGGMAKVQKQNHSVADSASSHDCSSQSEDDEDGDDHGCHAEHRQGLEDRCKRRERCAMIVMS